MMHFFLVLSLSFRCAEFTFTKRTLMDLCVMLIYVSRQINASTERFKANGTFERLIFTMYLKMSTISGRYIENASANFTWIRFIVMR